MTALLLLGASLLLTPSPTVGALIATGEAGRAHELLVESIDDERMRYEAPDTQLWANLLRYLRCAELSPSPATPNDPLRFGQARALLDLEVLRLARMRREGRDSGPASWLVDGRLSWRRPPIDDEVGLGAARGTKARATTPVTLVVWPPERERWSDEKTVVAAPDVLCRRPLGDAALLARLDLARAPKAGDRAKLSDEAEAMRSARLQMVAGVPVRAALIVDEAVIRARLGEWPEVWVLIRMLDEEMKQPSAGPIAAEEQAEMAMLSGLAAEKDGRNEEALARWNHAADLPLPLDERQFVDLHRQRHLIALGQPREARVILDAYTSLAGDLGRYLRYRSALVRYQTKDEAGLLSIARELLGKRSIAEHAADPIARATEELVYLELSRHPFSPAQVEVVESIGLVREVYQRLEMLGTLAIERGHPELGRDVFRWLLEHQTLAWVRPLYLGRLAVASALLDDEAGFKTNFNALIEETVAATPGAQKRAKVAVRARAQKPSKKNLEWHRQILLTSRDALTPLVAHKAFASLRVFTDGLQKYLRLGANPPPFAEVTEIYRLASTQLPTGARAYAEKVGADHQPVWLGEVTIDRPRMLVPEPDLELPTLVGPVTLLCLPDGKGACPRWFGPPQRDKPAAAKTAAIGGPSDAR